MGRNVGGIDRILRIVVGLILIALVFVGPQTVWGWIGVVPLLTGLIGWCPPYSLLGINTCSK
jgi:membrane protein implicated in regulation of membrane protease activity